MVIVGEHGSNTEIWVNDKGQLVGRYEAGQEVVFATRRDLIDVWGPHQADEIMRRLLIISFGADERLVF